MPLLTWSEASPISYVISDIAVLLSPEQQSIAVQALQRFTEGWAWSDYETYSDDIDTLMASLIDTLETPLTIPPDTAPETLTIFHINDQNEVGNAIALTISASQIFNHYAAQSPAAVTDKFQTSRFWLAGGHSYVIDAYCVRGAGAGIIKLQLIRANDEAILDEVTQDLYNATSTFNFKVQLGEVLAETTRLYIRGQVTGKNAASSGYGVAVSGFLIWS